EVSSVISNEEATVISTILGNNICESRVIWLDEFLKYYNLYNIIGNRFRNIDEDCQVRIFFSLDTLKRLMQDYLRRSPRSKVRFDEELKIFFDILTVRLSLDYNFLIKLNKLGKNVIT
ncbi:MAG: hypothetical protein QW250_01340, partial [Sulfolobaceae archaeon]